MSFYIRGSLANQAYIHHCFFIAGGFYRESKRYKTTEKLRQMGLARSHGLTKEEKKIKARAYLRSWRKRT